VIDLKEYKNEKIVTTTRFYIADGIGRRMRDRRAQASRGSNAVAATAGLQRKDIKVGTGASPKPGQICVMHYTGWLYQNGVKGKKFGHGNCPELVEG
jgi:peptidylprolyl isomerase